MKIAGSSTVIISSIAIVVSMRSAFGSDAEWTSGTGAVYTTDIADSVGIGTASPRAGFKLDVAGGGIRLNGGPDFVLQADDPGDLVFRTAANTEIGRVYALNNSGLHLRANGARAADVFLRYSDGYVGIGTTSPSMNLHVNGAALVSGMYASLPTSGKGISIFYYAAGGTGYIQAFDFGTVSNIPLSITASKINLSSSVLVGEPLAPPNYKLEVFNCSGSSCAGKPGGGTWSASSDVRLKTNIQPLTGALETLTRLEPVLYEWINTTEHDNIAHAGFVAQEVESVFPAWVGDVDPRGDDKDLIAPGDKVKTLYFPHDFNAYVVAAIREIKKKNETLESRVNSLLDIVCIDHPDAVDCKR